MTYMKETLAAYKEEHPELSHKESFAAVAALWGEADANPNKGKEKKARAPRTDKPKTAPKAKSTRGRKAKDEESGGDEEDIDDAEEEVAEKKEKTKSKPASKSKKVKKDEAVEEEDEEE
ncbi:hypothetical protein BS47DRAFT_1336582 [Hydnum rufescens UP504]|uniref:HMG box domain-containing protein n=1 Tax=Hydnum rufescens UP504 TaxID=1448309 RepID=A0A9P6DYU4_9AGAM|nr:hypothetical protein BS47DRAFT_1336582 [Hydnum rufescens UP504]